MLVDWQNTLEEIGWVELNSCLEGKLDNHLHDLSKILGLPVSGRNNTILEELKPILSKNAHPRSLSKQYGVGSLPLHSDTAHWLTPCRYILLGCEEAGEVSSPTILQDTKNLSLDEEEEFHINNASFFIQNGRKSFYSSIRSKSRPFFRFDPGCMIPTSPHAELAMKSLMKDKHKDKIIEIQWQKDKILIIDNWRMLHGRGNKQSADQKRKLLRVMVQ